MPTTPWSSSSGCSERIAGPLMGFEPTGREFRCQMTAFFIFDGAGLVCERVYFDSATILRQLTA